MNHTWKLAPFAASLAAGAVALTTGCVAEPTAEPSAAISVATSALTTTHDVDVAAGCEGILSYVNATSQADLASYLPDTVAAAIVSRRASQPFVSLADLSSVSGIAQARLALITSHARTGAYIGAACAGVFEELSVSADDQVAILGFVNTASQATLEAVVRVERASTAAALIARRPFTTLQAVVDTTGVGPATFRSLRNAAVPDPFDALIARVNAPGRDTTLNQNFDWFAMMFDQPGRQGSMECFGVPADAVAQMGGTMRPNLATAAEVLADVTGTVNYANRYGGLGDTTAGLAHFAADIQGATFLGCYISFNPDPWSGTNRAFFVDTVTGSRILSETRWSE